MAPYKSRILSQGITNSDSRVAEANARAVAYGGYDPLATMFPDTAPAFPAPTGAVPAATPFVLPTPYASATPQNTVIGPTFQPPGTIPDNQQSVPADVSLEDESRITRLQRDLTGTNSNIGQANDALSRQDDTPNYYDSIGPYPTRSSPLPMPAYNNGAVGDAVNKTGLLLAITSLLGGGNAASLYGGNLLNTAAQAGQQTADSNFSRAVAARNASQQQQDQQYEDATTAYGARSQTADRMMNRAIQESSVRRAANQAVLSQNTERAKAIEAQLTALQKQSLDTIRRQNDNIVKQITSGGFDDVEPLLAKLDENEKFVQRAFGIGAADATSLIAGGLGEDFWGKRKQAEEISKRKELDRKSVNWQVAQRILSAEKIGEGHDAARVESARLMGDSIYRSRVYQSLKNIEQERMRQIGANYRSDTRNATQVGVANLRGDYSITGMEMKLQSLMDENGNFVGKAEVQKAKLMYAHSASIGKLNVQQSNELRRLQGLMDSIQSGRVGSNGVDYRNWTDEQKTEELGKIGGQYKKAQDTYNETNTEYLRTLEEARKFQDGDSEEDDGQRWSDSGASTDPYDGPAKETGLSRVQSIIQKAVARRQQLPAIKYLQPQSAPVGAQPTQPVVVRNGNEGNPAYAKYQQPGTAYRGEVQGTPITVPNRKPVTQQPKVNGTRRTTNTKVKNNTGPAFSLGPTTTMPTSKQEWAKMLLKAAQGK